jgi:hypothetical protein
VGVQLFYTPAAARDNPETTGVDFGSMPQENVTFQQLFDQALSAQQQKNTDEALRLYQEVLDKGQGWLTAPQTSVVYHNMSTLAYDKSDFLHAYVWSKKAMVQDPGNHAAQQAFQVYAKKFEVPSIPHQISTAQNLQMALEKVPTDAFFILSLIFLFLSLRFFFKNLLSKRQNQIEMKTGSSFAWAPLVSFILFVVIFGATIARWDLDQRTLAILTAEKTGIQTAPGENKSVIFEAQPGLQVEVLQLSNNYAQIRYPGAFSGWVPLQSLEILSAKPTSK